MERVLRRLGWGTDAHFVNSSLSLVRPWLIYLPFPFFVIVSLAFFGPSHVSAFSRELFSPTPDSQSFVWFLNWWPFALAHHLNPFITKYVWYPVGFDLAWATAVPAVALAMAPVTLVLGAQASFNILAIAAPALSAAACFYLVNYLTKEYLPALVAGYLYGFSSYELGQMLAHTNLDLTFLVPLAVLLFILRVHGRIGRIWYVLLFALVLAIQFGTSSEIFATTSFFGAISIGVFWLLGERTLRRNIWDVCVDSLWAYAAAIVVLAPYLYYMVSGAGSVPGQINSPALYSVDLANFIIPTPVTRIDLSTFGSTAATFDGGNFGEMGAYLGLPIILILLRSVTTNWRKYETKAITIILGITAIASLGPVLHIYGNSLGVPLPWLIATHVPLLRYALPARFSLYVALIAAVGVAYWLSGITSRTQVVPRYGAVIIAVLFMVPNSQYFVWSAIKVPAFLTQAQVGHYLSVRENVVFIPYGPEGQSMYFQYASAMRFTQSGGYVGYPPAQFRTAFGWKRNQFEQGLRDFCKQNRVSKLIVAPQTNSLLAANIEALAWPSQVVDGYTVISVPNE